MTEEDPWGVSESERAELARRRLEMARRGSSESRPADARDVSPRRVLAGPRTLAIVILLIAAVVLVVVGLTTSSPDGTQRLSKPVPYSLVPTTSPSGSDSETAAAATGATGSTLGGAFQGYVFGGTHAAGVRTIPC